MGAEVGYLAAFVGGVLALLSPCGALLLPSFFAYAFDRPALLLRRTAVFYAGLVTTLVPLGVSASSLTIFVRSHQRLIVAISGAVIIVLGVVTALGGGFVLLRPSAREESGADSTGPAGVYAMGLAAGLTGFCTGPILGSILVLAAAGGRPVRGGVLLAIYALGMVVPLVVLSLTWGRWGQGLSRRLRGRAVTLGRWTFHSTSLISGAVLVAIGAWLLYAGGALVDSESVALTGARVEEWATSLGDRISDELLAVVAFVGAAAWMAVRWFRGDARRSGADGRRARRGAPAATVSSRDGSAVTGGGNPSDGGVAITARSVLGGVPRQP